MIFEVLSTDYLKEPSCQEDWLAISNDVKNIWNLPRTIGAIDGKHIRIKAPHNSGSLYCNYKKYFSIQFMAISDARYCFTSVDIESYGYNNDKAVLNDSKMGKKFRADKYSVPNASSLDGCTFDPLPYFLVGDEIFPSTTWLMRPYPGNLTEPQRVFNYRLSHARRVVENSFGILVAR